MTLTRACRFLPVLSFAALLASCGPEKGPSTDEVAAALDASEFAKFNALTYEVTAANCSSEADGKFACALDFHTAGNPSMHEVRHFKKIGQKWESLE